MAAEIEVAVLLPGVWAASVAHFSLDLSATYLVLSCSVEWAEPARSHWGTDCFTLLTRTCLPKIQHIAAARYCVTALCVCWQWSPQLCLGHTACTLD